MLICDANLTLATVFIFAVDSRTFAERVPPAEGMRWKYGNANQLFL